jgi:hypothetical protein
MHTGLDWYFVYTREAHPGEHLTAHAGFGDKLAAARRLRDEIGIIRPILVDDVEGTVHRAYGLMPNMSWVLDRRGTILYKAMWTSAADIAGFLERREAGASAGGASTFYAEQLAPVARDRDGFQRGLERNGPRAAAEFARAEELWAERARALRSP